MRVLRSVPIADEEDQDTDAVNHDRGLATVGRGRVATIHHHASTIEEHTELGGECGVCLGTTFTGFEEGDVIELIEERAISKG